MSLTDEEKWAAMNAPYFGAQWSSEGRVTPRSCDLAAASRYG